VAAGVLADQFKKFVTEILGGHFERMATIVRVRWDDSKYVWVGVMRRRGEAVEEVKDD